MAPKWRQYAPGGFRMKTVRRWVYGPKTGTICSRRLQKEGGNEVGTWPQNGDSMFGCLQKEARNEAGIWIQNGDSMFHVVSKWSR